MICVVRSPFINIIDGNNSIHDLFWKGEGILVKF